jgi:resolvase-like protein
MRLLVAARLSQLAPGQTGLDSQDAESTRWAERAGHAVVHIAADRKSGTSQPWDRPNLRPWVTEPEKLAQYDGVLAYRLDRLSRGDNASTNAIEQWAHDHGKQLLTVDGLTFPCEGKAPPTTLTGTVAASPDSKVIKGMRLPPTHSLCRSSRGQSSTRRPDPPRSRARGELGLPQRRGASVGPAYACPLLLLGQDFIELRPEVGDHGSLAQMLDRMLQPAPVSGQFVRS